MQSRLPWRNAGKMLRNDGSLRDDSLAQHRFDEVGTNRSRAQDPRLLARKIQHGRFHPRGAGAGIQNQPDPVAQVFRHMFGPRRRKPVRTIGRWCRDWPIRRRDQGPGHGVRRNPYADERHTGSRRVRNRPRFRQNQREWPWPEGIGQFLGIVRPILDALPANPLDRLAMHDQGIGLRPALGFEDLTNGRFVGGIRPQAINGLGRKRHKAAGSEDRGGLADDFGVGGGWIDGDDLGHGSAPITYCPAHSGTGRECHLCGCFEDFDGLREAVPVSSPDFRCFS